MLVCVLLESINVCMFVCDIKPEYNHVWLANKPWGNLTPQLPFNVIKVSGLTQVGISKGSKAYK